jgi:hypothetical protein
VLLQHAREKIIESSDLRCFPANGQVIVFARLSPVESTLSDIAAQRKNMFRNCAAA